jgi:hypothetical protein
MTSTPTGAWPEWLVAGNFNNDSLLDVAVANYGSYDLYILLGFGNGSFSSPNIYSTGYSSYTHGVAMGDFNNDGRLDITVANSGTDNIGVFLGYGDGTFSSMVPYSAGSGSQPRSVTVGDFNGDNLSDIVVANQGIDNIGVFLGYGDGTFQNIMYYSTGSGSGPFSVGVGDFNNDKKVDFVVANRGTSNIGIQLAFADELFFNQLTYATGDYSSPEWVVVGDFNNDSRLDVVVANSERENVGVFLGYHAEGFLQTPAYLIGSSSQPTSVTIGDFNNDTRLDVAVVNNGTNNVVILLGSGYGTFSSQTNYSTSNGSYPCSVGVGDFNNDNRLDIAVANSGTGNVGVFLGYGNGTFSSQTTYFTGLDSQPYSIAVGDFDNDTRLDIAVANYGINNVGILFGYGNGSFQSQMNFQLGFGAGPFAVAFGDVNNDNSTDIIIANNGFGTMDILLKAC